MGSIFGFGVILTTLGAARGAPQEAAGFSMACALAIVPYVLARAVQALNAPNLSDEMQKIVTAIENGPKVKS